MKSKINYKIGSVILITILMLIIQGIIPTVKSNASSQITLTFSDDEITETVSGSGYTISDTTLTITASGTYRITGSCTEGNIEVKKGTTGVVLILDNLTLSSSTTAPVVIKKSGTEATIQLVGTSTLTDLEDPNNETSTDADVADSFEGAAIKVKSSSSLTISGTGTLNIDGTNCKNGIKGAAESSITINSGTINATTANSGIACDGTLTINGGTINTTTDGDGIKSEPDEDDTTSAGAIIINGGTITVNSQGDGIHAANNLTITDGTFYITTLNGYASSNFDSDTMSCKGLKASSDQDGVESEITITGGNFYINSADDAVHSDAYITVTYGTFEILTGDDGFHADTSLILGSEDGLERDPFITINSSYEGLEGGTVYIYSGKYYVVSDDDGINAAGGSSSGTEQGNTGGDNFNSGGGGPNNNSNNFSTSSDYAIYIYDGKIFVNADGDGLDSNGDIYIYGGTLEVWGMQAGGDNEPIDLDGNLTINDATVFAAGTTGLTSVHSAITSINQNYKYTSTSYSSGKSIYIKNSSTVEYHTTTPKSINYVFYTSPNCTSSYSISNSGSATCSTGNAWSHTWDSGVITTVATSDSNGIITYTCQECGAIERQTIHYSGIDVSVENKTNGLATVTLGDETSAEDFSAAATEGTISVCCEKACIVIITTDDGTTYSKISAEETEEDDTYNFTFDLSEDLNFIVALKGDINLNGSVTTADTMLINRSLVSSSASAYRELSILEFELADMNTNGTITTADTMLINRSILSEAATAYLALEW